MNLFRDIYLEKFERWFYNNITVFDVLNGLLEALIVALMISFSYSVVGSYRVIGALAPLVIVGAHAGLLYLVCKGIVNFDIEEVIHTEKLNITVVQLVITCITMILHLSI